MSNSYTYPAIITRAGNTEIFFPDFGLRTCSESSDINSVIEEAQDFLALVLIDKLDYGEELPAASADLDGYQLPPDGKIVFINVWLPYFRSKSRIIYTKKTLTIPTWLDILAKEKSVNFSALLVNAIKKELQID